MNIDDAIDEVFRHGDLFEKSTHDDQFDGFITAGLKNGLREAGFVWVLPNGYHLAGNVRLVGIGHSLGLAAAGDHQNDFQRQLIVADLFKQIAQRRSAARDQYSDLQRIVYRMYRPGRHRLRYACFT